MIANRLVTDHIRRRKKGELRIVFVSSMTHIGGKIDFEDINVGHELVTLFANTSERQEDFRGGCAGCQHLALWSCCLASIPGPLITTLFACLVFATRELAQYYH